MFSVFTPVEAFFSTTIGSKSISFPQMESNAPFITSSKPCPPESTTPASFNTGSISGVCDKTCSMCLITSAPNSIISSVFETNSIAFVAPPRATVKMVPSFGFITALYAVSTALSNAFAKIVTFTCS